MTLTDVPTNATCFGSSTGSIIVTASGGTSPYSFSGTNGPSDDTLSNIAKGSYTITVSDANGCSSTITDTIGQDNLLTVSLNGVNPSCNGDSSGSLTPIPSGGAGGSECYRFLWSDGSDGHSLGGLPAGIYGVTVTDCHGCTASASDTLTNPAQLTVSLSGTNPACYAASTGNVTSTVNGGTGIDTYHLGNTGVSTTDTLSGLSAGSYGVTVTDAHGCTVSGTFTVGQPSAPLSIADSITNVSCFGGSNGALALTVSGGTPASILISWSNSNTNSSLSGLSAGSYSVTVTDAYGCTASRTDSVSQPQILAVTDNVTDVTCAGGNDGAIALTVTGGTQSYSFAWSNSATTQSLGSLVQGVYSVTVTDAHGCSATLTSSVNTLYTLIVNTAATNASCGQSNGSASVSISGGTMVITATYGALTALLLIQYQVLPQVLIL